MGAERPRADEHVLDPTEAVGPLFWFVPPTTTPSRYFPSLASIAANTTNASTGGCSVKACHVETLPTSDRTMHFVGTARDGASGLATTDVTVEVAGTTRFSVTSPNAGEALTNHSDVTVTWDVAGTDTAPVNTPTVDILLSNDGGLSFPTVLAEAVPNDGSELVRINAVNGASARIMVRGHGNIFFDTSDANSTILAGANTALAARSVSAVAGDRRATVSWTQPLDDGGSPILRYRVFTSPGGRSCSTTGALSCTVKGLAPGTDYTFRVRAATALGPNPMSAPSEAMTPYGPPGEPTAVTVAARNDRVLVSWTAPVDDGGRPVTRYRASASPGGASCLASTGTACAIAPLDDTVTYTITVQARNVAGYGTTSAPSDPVKPR